MGGVGGGGRGRRHHIVSKVSKVSTVSMVGTVGNAGIGTSSSEHSVYMSTYAWQAQYGAHLVLGAADDEVGGEAEAA